MGNTESRGIYFKENGIDPYKILDISKNASKKDIKRAYKKKALILHPDKTGGKTELQYKILKECYEYVTDLADTLETKLPNELKSKFSSNEEIYYEPDRQFHKTNFDDQSTRSRLFVNNDLPFERMESILEQKQKGPINYSDVEKKAYKDPFDGKGYNREKFNAFFELNYQRPQETLTGGVPEAMSSLEFSSLNPLEIQTYNGLILEKKQTNNFSLEYTENDPASLNELGDSKIKKMVGKLKKDQNSISKKKFNELLTNKKNEKFEVDTSKTFRENEALLYEDKIKTMKSEMDNNKRNIMDHISVYPKNIVEQFKMGTLDDSSTVLRNNTLEIPRGIRFR
jgi:curved DNA-binding protein CbpA